MNVSKKSFSGDNLYFIYHIGRKERGNYLNTWFPGNNIDSNNYGTSVAISKKNKSYAKALRTKKLEPGEVMVFRDEYWTVKEVDRSTMHHLYGIRYNPISIWIMCLVGAEVKRNNNGQLLYNMKVHVYSIDDASYGIWFHEQPIDELIQTRKEVMMWISLRPVINGEELLTYCESLGGKDKDYN